MSDLKLSILIKAIDGVTAPVKAMNKQIGSISKSFAPAWRDFKNLGKDIPQVAGAFGGVGRAARGVAGEIGKLTLKAGVLAGGLAFLFKKTVDEGDSLNDLAKRLGVPVESLSRLKLSADQSGTSIEEVGTGLKFLSKNMAAAGGGSKQAIGLFRQFGVQIKDSSGKMRGSEAVLRDLADRFKEMPDGAQKTASALALFGRSGDALIPLLAQGSEELKRQAKLAEELGIVWSETDAKAADEFNDALAVLHGAFEGIWKGIVVDLLPVIKPLVADLIKWIGANRELIKTKAQDFIKSVGAAAKGLWEGLQKVWAVLKPLVDFLGPGNTAFLLFAATIGGPLVVSLLSLVGAVKALSIALATTPLGLFLLGLTAIVLMANRLKNAFLVGFGDGALEVLKMLNPLQGLLNLLNWIVEKLSGLDIGGKIGKAFHSLGALPDAAFNKAADAYGNAAYGGLAPVASRTQVGGQINVGFRNAPPGMQVEGIRQQGPVGLSAETGVMFR